MQRDALVAYLDQYFDLAHFPANDDSQNGLQVEGNPQVSKIATAVDACLDTFQDAAAQNVQMLLVHHGLFWKKSLVLTGNHGTRVATLIKNDISLYAMHLPLDMHQEIGNNVLLAKKLQLQIVRPFGNYHGMAIGVEARSPRPITRKSLATRIEKSLQTSVQMLGFGPEKIKNIAIVSGGGAREITTAVRQKVDILLTGEGGHTVYHQCKEAKINLAYAGHYATETVGIKALGEHLAAQFSLKHVFLHHPTGF